ncbi:MAG: hypothetical protein GHCLOJNM_04035 [bacterium]|nr:hypothetical protein [bacterium]
MNPKAVALIALVAAGLLVVFLVGPPKATEPTQEAPPANPWELPYARHMAEHDIHIGPSPEDDIQVSRDGSKIRIEIRTRFLERQPADFLSKVGFAQAVEFVSEDGFHAFLDALHMTLPDHEDFDSEGPGNAHEHDHEHDHPEGEEHKNP